MYLAYPTYASIIFPIPKLVIRGNVNTTSIPYTEPSWYDPISLSKLLERHLRQMDNVNVLCMHHVGIKRPFQGCSMRNRGTIYFMLNPLFHNVSGKHHVVYEDSQSCREQIKSTRRECIDLSWTDGESKIRGEFCGNVAISLQLMFDEFKGNGHCSNQQRS